METDKLLAQLLTEAPEHTRDLDRLGEELLSQQQKIDHLEQAINAMLATVREGINK
ncbi:MAG: hypothetical protein HKN70_08655 [Gammaproteobacteria bacterium]|nr:hypothetical protein [Gammaproteobacteria bacterium]